MENPVMVFGATTIGRVAKEIFESNGNVVYGFLDDNKELHGKEIDDVSILGRTDDDGFLKLIGKKCEAFIATDDNKLRKSLVKMLNEVRHVQAVNCIHGSSVIASSSSLGHGNFVDAGAVVGAGAVIGNHNLVGARAVIGAEVVVGDYVQIGAGAIINAGVKIEDEVFIGTGAIVVSGVTLQKGARVGAGSVVIGMVKSGETVFGNPAEKVNS